MTTRKVGSTTQKRSLRVIRFAGVALAGGKTDKTCLAIVEYYPEQNRIFLRSVKDRIRGDENLIQALLEEEVALESVSIDAPLQLPICIRCQLKCPGVESCKEPEVKWLRAQYEVRNKLKRPGKPPTPYTERCSEVFIAQNLEIDFHPSHAMGANAAPLAARAHFLLRRLARQKNKLKLLEFFPKLTVWRLGRALKVPKSYLLFHRHAVSSDEARAFFLRQLKEKTNSFIYDQDLKNMIENPICFDAFMGALTGYLESIGETQKRPVDFPKREVWIAFPDKDLDF